ncbi:TetR family transcriptional regulator [Nonomuraea sp. NPDC050643]|uniref:TetR/AcrR family transcriptional regulator n=1 Tax=Nonomuraea sp. NPDC050643 TaxID=3155660 RepID=UPI00340B22D9
MESHRERKKRHTKQLLVTTAFRLFDEQGYEQTTIEQIASAADVARKTFFNYFPSKADVVFAGMEQYVTVASQLLAARTRHESVADLLLRIFDRAIASYLVEGPMADQPELAEIYFRLVTTVPALQTRAMNILTDLQHEIAQALLTSFPDQLDPISAAAAVGSMMGAVQAAGLAGHELGQSEEEQIASMRRAAEIAVRGLRSF